MRDSDSDCALSGASPLNLTLYFLAGGIAGAAVALLLAPQSGRATRQMVSRNVTDAAGSARDLKDEFVRRGRSIRDEAKHRVDDAVSALSGDGEPKLPV
jgi:gas vesicle protein